jgi:hypothetical protein
MFKHRKAAGNARFKILGVRLGSEGFHGLLDFARSHKRCSCDYTYPTFLAFRRFCVVPFNFHAEVTQLLQCSLCVGSRDVFGERRDGLQSEIICIRWEQGCNPLGIFERDLRTSFVDKDWDVVF